MNTAVLMKSSGRRFVPSLSPRTTLAISWRVENFDVPVVKVPKGASKALRRKLCKEARLELARAPA